MRKEVNIKILKRGTIFGMTFSTLIIVNSSYKIETNKCVYRVKEYVDVAALFVALTSVCLKHFHQTSNSNKMRLD